MILDTKINILASVFTQIVDDEMIILDTQSANYFALDAIGTVMWEQLSVDASLAHLYAYMLEAYEVEASVLLEDMTIFIAKLEEKALIEREDV
ncbi:MAG: PqqD family protein [Sulfurovum sp.]|nr:PqqD family protein [Sulfurovum sp.]